MTDPTRPPPLPEHPEDGPRREVGPGGLTSSKVVPWVVLALVLIVMLTIASCVKRCSESVDTLMEELSKYNTEPGNDWEAQEVHDAAVLLRRYRTEGYKLEQALRGEAVVVRGTVTRLERPDEDSARLEFETPDGTIQVSLWTMSTRALEALDTAGVGQTVTIGGFVDWMNRGTIAVRNGMFRSQWLPRDPEKQR